MITWTRVRQSVDTAGSAAAPWIARAAGVTALVIGVRATWRGIGMKWGVPTVAGFLLGALGLGVVLLRPTALRLATILSVFIAMVLPIGGLSPFSAGDLPFAQTHAPGFVAHRVATVLSSAIGFVLLAHFLGVARLGQRARGQKAHGLQAR